MKMVGINLNFLMKNLVHFQVRNLTLNSESSFGGGKTDGQT
jgi:hypothetical protein